MAYWVADVWQIIGSVILPAFLYCKDLQEDMDEL